MLVYWSKTVIHTKLEQYNFTSWTGSCFEVINGQLHCIVFWNDNCLPHYVNIWLQPWKCLKVYQKEVQKDDYGKVCCVKCARNNGGFVGLFYFIYSSSCWLIMRTKIKPWFIKHMHCWHLLFYKQTSDRGGKPNWYPTRPWCLDQQLLYFLLFTFLKIVGQFKKEYYYN